VGYGDISPQTGAGQLLAAVVMVLGYSIIAVPTKIVTAELATLGGFRRKGSNTQACTSCSAEGHDDNADFCKFCGTAL
jgi:voltage-gated potassium channel